MFIDLRELRLLAAQGLDMRGIARALKVPYIRVRRAFAYYLPEELAKQAPPEPSPLKRWREMRLDRLRALAEAGKTRTQAAQELGVCLSTLRKLAREAGADFGRQQRPGDEQRAEKMALMYRQGLTLAKIGGKFGVTRERVRQILRRMGVDAAEGGQAKTCEAKTAAYVAKRDAHHLVRFGMVYADYCALRQTGATKAFKQQRSNAKRRGIEWSMTLAQWWAIWQASGQWERRGRGKGRYVMSRIKDSGGYEVGNVHVQLAEENSLEAVDKWIGKTKANPGVFCLYPGTNRPYLAKVGRVRLGLFRSEAEAVAARHEYVAANGLAMKADCRVMPVRSSPHPLEPHP